MSTSEDNNGLVPRGTQPSGSPMVQSPPGTLARTYGYGYGYGYGAAEDDSPVQKMRELLRILKKNKWIILTAVIVSTTIVTLASYKVQDTYQASATVQIGDEMAVVPGMQPYYVFDYGDKRFNTRLRQLQMPDLILKVVVLADLQNEPNVFSSKPTTLSGGVWSIFRNDSVQAQAKAPVELLPPIDSGKPLDEETRKRLGPYVGVVMGGLTVNAVKDTQLVSISYQHHDPDVAYKVANTVAEVFIQEDLKQRTESKASASGFLQERIAELQTQIRSGEERLLQYAKSNEIVSIENDEQNTVVLRLQKLTEELLTAETARINLEADRQALKAAGASTDLLKLTSAQGDTGATEVSRQLSVLRQKQAELRMKYTEEWPELRLVNEQIAALEIELEKVKARIAASFEVQYQAALTRERSLREEVEKQRAETMKQNEAAISYRIIQQEVETNKKLLETILSRAKEVDISAASESSPISLTNRAVRPGGPTGPNRSRWIMMAFAVALLGSIGLALGREYLDQTIRSIEDVDRVVRLPSLGVIPALVAGKRAKKHSRRRALPASTNGQGANGIGQESAGLITSLDAKSSAAEAYRQLRTSVLLSSAGHPSKLLLVTSSQPREGKTTTAVNTAISLAQTGATTIIIDCDMRKPRVHHLLNVSNNVGVSLYLSGQTEDLSVLVQPHQIPNLSVLPCGPVPPNPAELIGSDQMRKLLTQLGKEYDHIVIDSPPVVSFADPAILSTMVDGVILVVRGGFSGRGVVLRARQLLSDVGAKIYGVVLNDADMKASGSYYYYTSYYDKYYTSENEG